MVEGLWLWFSCRRSCHGSCGFGRGVGGGEEVDFLGNGAAQVVEGFAKIGWIVVGLIGVLGAGLMLAYSLFRVV